MKKNMLYFGVLMHPSFGVAKTDSGFRLWV